LKWILTFVQIGYFIADNATNLDTFMREMGDFGINEFTQRLRCLGHIINLSVSALFTGEWEGEFAEDHEYDLLDEASVTELQIWRRIGPIAKLRYITMWLFDSEPRMRRLTVHQIQAGEKQLYPIKPIATRWNTLEAMMERGIQIRVSIDAVVMEEVVGTYYVLSVQLKRLQTF
jgi:hypothetical protein